MKAAMKLKEGRKQPHAKQRGGKAGKKGSALFPKQNDRLHSAKSAEFDVDLVYSQSVT